MKKLLLNTLIGLALLTCQTSFAQKTKAKFSPIKVETPARPANQQDVIQLVTPKLETVRVGFIGLGMRGPGAVERWTHIPGTQIVALCDLLPERVENAQKILEKAGLPKAASYAGDEKAWKKLCERDDIDVVYIATGGDVIDYPERRHCCGFGFRQYLVMANRGYSVANSKKKFESMQPYEPDFIVANCPGCAMFMDKWQYTISEMEGTTYGQDGYGIPVLTYEELTALVLGYDPWEIGLQMHQVSVEPLLDKMGIPYDPEAKFKNIRGEDIGAPKCPTYLRVSKL